MVSMVLSGDLVAPLTVSAAPEACPTGSPRLGSLARIIGVLRPAVYRGVGSTGPKPPPAARRYNQSLRFRPMLTKVRLTRLPY